jgi:hypothetical protein
MQQTLPWIIALVAVALLIPAALLLGLRQRKPPPTPSLPAEWNLVPRPVFSTDERRVYRQLREALPHHIVLSKLPLVRFCQPHDPQEVRFWYELLGSIHVTFAICSANGRVLAAIDLENDRGNSRRALQIKQSVLAACRVRYLRCPVDHLPSIPELQLLVPHSAAARGPQPAPNGNAAREGGAGAAPSRRRERTTLWQDSSFFQDSFFSPDNRSEYSNPSGFGPLSATAPAREAPPGAEPPSQGESPDDIVGVVVDSPRYGSTRH